MDKYARSLAGQGQKISPEDSDYKEKLIHVVQSFRTFDVALDDFILHHGYTGELSDIDGKIRFIKAKFNLFLAILLKIKELCLQLLLTILNIPYI